MKNYVPRAGTRPARAIELLREHGPLTSSVLAKSLDIRIENLKAALEAALSHGVIKCVPGPRSARGQAQKQYMLADAEPPAADTATEEDAPNDDEEQNAFTQRVIAAHEAAPISAPGLISSVFALGAAVDTGAIEPRDDESQPQPPAPAAGLNWRAPAQATRAPKAAPPNKPVHRLAPVATAARMVDRAPAGLATSARSTARPPTDPSPPIAATSGLECALFNTGTLHIEVPGQEPLRLKREHARDLVAYLRRIETALMEEHAS